MSWIDDLGKLANEHDKGFNPNYPDLRIEINIEQLVEVIKKIGGPTIMVFETKEQLLHFNPLATDSLIRIFRPSLTSSDMVLFSQIHGPSEKDAEHVASLLLLVEQHKSIFRSFWSSPVSSWG